MPQKIARLAFFVAALAFIGAWGYGFYMENHFASYPRQPDRTSEHVVPYKWKSTTIYLTTSESGVVNVLHVIEIASLVLGGLSFATVWWIRKRR